MKLFCGGRRSAMSARLAVPALVMAAVVALGGAALADGKKVPPADLERLLSAVKAQHPQASILKVEREAAEGNRGEVYEVKLLRPDGQVLKLYFDAATMAPVSHADEGEESPEHRRRRERHRGHW